MSSIRSVLMPMAQRAGGATGDPAIDATNATTAGTTITAAAAGPAPKVDTTIINQMFYNYIFIILASVVAGLIVWRVTLESVKYVRTLACLDNDTQRYFILPAQHWATFKKGFLYAPIFVTRHSREFKLSAAINVGTLPTRFQLLFLLAYLGTNVSFCVLSIDWAQPKNTVFQAVRKRTGILSTVNLVPLLVMASRNNPLLKWLNLSFDTFNLLHRWFGRIVVLEALAHVIAYAYQFGSAAKFFATVTEVGSMEFYGFVGIVAMLTMSIQAASVFRHAFYETFKYVHIVLAATVLAVIYIHLARLAQQTLIFGCVAIWGLERLTRVSKLVYRNIGAGGTSATVEAMPGNACRVTVQMARPWAFKPGQHAYLYMPSVGLTTSHPFSIAWSEEAEIPAEDEKMSVARHDILGIKSTSMSFVIRARTGFTDKLFKKAEASKDGKFYTKCFAEGPYGGNHMMHSYGTVMLFAGGVGITHQVPHVRDLVAGHASGTIAAKKIVLIWTVQSPEHLEWIRPWMTAILGMDKRRECLRILLFISRPRNTKEVHSPSSTVQMFPGRPNITSLLDAEVDLQVGAMGVSVCGGGALSDDVRRAVRDRQHISNIDFVEEAFSW